AERRGLPGVDDDLAVDDDVVDRPDRGQSPDGEHDPSERGAFEQAERLGPVELDEPSLRLHWNPPRQKVSSRSSLFGAGTLRDDGPPRWDEGAARPARRGGGRARTEREGRPGHRAPGAPRARMRSLGFDLGPAGVDGDLSG